MGAFTHELKTPMTSIIGYADMLRTAQGDPDEQREAAAPSTTRAAASRT